MLATYEEDSNGVIGTVSDCGLFFGILFGYFHEDDTFHLTAGVVLSLN